MECNFHRCFLKTCTFPWKLRDPPIGKHFRSSEVDDIIRYSFKMKNKFQSCFSQSKTRCNGSWTFLDLGNSIHQIRAHCCGRQKESHILSLRTCGCVTFRDRKNFADVIKALKKEPLLWTSRVGTDVITGSSVEVGVMCWAINWEDGAESGNAGGPRSWKRQGNCKPPEGTQLS